MASSAKSVETAISLMKRALTLLDHAGDDLAAAHLQHAIDTAVKAPIASSADDVAEHFPSPHAPGGRVTMRSFLAKLNAIGRASADRAVQEWGWRFGGGAHIARGLLDLGLDVRKLPPQSRAKLRQDIAAIGHGAREPDSWRRAAMRFFTWYVTEASDFTPAALKGGAVADALTTIQSWCQADPELVKAAAPDFHRLQVHLFQLGRAAGGNPPTQLHRKP